MRHDRLFTPGTDAGGGAYRMRPLPAGRNAYRWAMDSGLLTRRAMCALAAVSPRRGVAVRLHAANDLTCRS
jgi:hypothetical protein